MDDDNWKGARSIGKKFIHDARTELSERWAMGYSYREQCCKTCLYKDHYHLLRIVHLCRVLA